MSSMLMVSNTRSSTYDTRSQLGVIWIDLPFQDLEGFLSFASSLDCGYIEIHSRQILRLDNNPERAGRRMAELLSEFDLNVSAVGVGNDFMRSGDALQREIDWIDHVCIAISQLPGRPLLRMGSGKQNPSVNPLDVNELLIRAYEGVSGSLKSHGFIGAVENHGHYLADRERFEFLMERLDPSSYGWTCDTMNFQWGGSTHEEAVDTFTRFIDRVVYVHLKDGIGVRESYLGKTLGAGTVPLEKFLEPLTARAYPGVYCVECECPSHDATMGYRQSLQWAKAILS